MNAQVNGTETPNPAIVTKVEIAWMAAGDASEAAAVATGRGVTLTALQDMANFMQATCGGVAPNNTGYQLSSSYLVSGTTYTPSVRITDSTYGQGSWTRGTAFNGTATTSTTSTTTSTSTTSTSTSTTSTSTTTGAALGPFGFETNGALTAPWQIPGNTNTGQTPHMPVAEGGSLKSVTTFWSVAQLIQSLTANQFAQADFLAASGTAGYGAVIRCRAGASDWNGYKARLFNLAGAVTVDLSKCANNAVASLSSYTLGSAAGYVLPGGLADLPVTLRITCVGTTISLYVNGTLRIQGTDSDLTSGYGGVWIDPTNGSQSSIDNLSFGNL